MVTYPSFETAFDSISKTAEEWDEEFSNMTLEEFHEFFEYAFCERLTAAVESGVNRKYVTSRLRMLGKLCEKFLESAHFLDGVTQEFRDQTEEMADGYFEILISLCDEYNKIIIKEIWEKSKNYCDRFGYKSGVVFEVLAPHRVFSPSTR